MLHDIYRHYAHDPLIPNEAIISDRFDASAMQSSSAWRLLHLSRLLAQRVLDAQGAIDRKALFESYESIVKHLYSLGPGREQEGSGMEHIASCLHLLQNDKEILSALRRIARPHMHDGADALIRRSLLHPHTNPLSDGDARQAALSAWFTPLRQHVGSCFATAPAILVQATQPLQFLADISQLFGIGGLKRVCEGYEYMVPLTAHAGLGALLLPIPITSLGPDPLHALAHSPGLIAAFKRCGALDGEDCHALLDELDTEQLFEAITADAIIQTVLRKKYRVTPQEIAEHQLRELHPMSLRLGYVATPSKCAAYLNAYHLAQEAFVAQAEHPLLKAWEYTLASFAEAKADTSRWNLYLSLGFDAKYPHGIGAIVHEWIQHRLESINDEIAAQQSRYDHTFAHVKTLEGRLSHVQTEQEMRYLQAEYHMQRTEIEQILNQRDAAYDKGRHLSSALSTLTTFYLEKFPTYFQEVYDASIREVSVGRYDDMPAGFRLLYKYGRTISSTWTLLYTVEDYLQALSSFFIATEQELVQRPELAGLERECLELVTALVLAIKDPAFLEHSLRRLAESYHEPLVYNPLENLDRIRRKPWAYISGGTMSTLVTTYYARSSPPKEVRRWVESEEELLVFYLDTLKELPLSLQQQLQSPKHGLLAYSPTHAFILKPAWFSQGWQTQDYTYSWVRDSWTSPAEAFWERQWIDTEAHEILLSKLLTLFPQGYHALLRQALRNSFDQRLLPGTWRTRLIEILSYEKWLRPFLPRVTASIDGLLFSTLPLHRRRDMDDMLHKIWEQIEHIERPLQERLHLTEDLPHVLTPQEVQEVAQGALIRALGQSHSHLFYTSYLIDAMRTLGYRAPAPILCADSNWPDKALGFVVNPSTLMWELWVFNQFGLKGEPLIDWKPYLNGSERKEWGVYTEIL